MFLLLSWKNVCQGRYGWTYAPYSQVGMHQIRFFSESVPVFDSKPSRTRRTEKRNRMEPVGPKKEPNSSRRNRKNRTGLEPEPWKPEPNRMESGFYIVRRISLLFHSVLFCRFRFPRFRFQTSSIFRFFESSSVLFSVQPVPFGSAFWFFRVDSVFRLETDSNRNWCIRTLR